MHLSYTGSPNTAGKSNKPKSICKNKNTIEIVKWLPDCNCNDKGISVSLLWLSVGMVPGLGNMYCQKLPGNAPGLVVLSTTFVALYL